MGWRLAAPVVGKCSLLLGEKELVEQTLIPPSKMRVTEESQELTPDCNFFFPLYLQDLFLGICALLLTICALQVIVSLASLGVGLRSFCGQSSRALVSC